MKLTKIFAVLFGLIGLAVAVAAVWICLTFHDASPILLSPATEARKSVVTMLDAVCGGDYAAASQQILGNPQFGASYKPEDPAEEMMWNAFQSSFSYELEQECFSTESGLALNTKITFLELESITRNLRERTQKLIQERIDAAESMDQIYNEHNEFLESFVMEALEDAVSDAIAQDARFKTVEITVNLIWRDSKWWVLPDAALMSALSGEITK